MNNNEQTITFPCMVTWAYIATLGFIVKLYVEILILKVSSI